MHEKLPPRQCHHLGLLPGIGRVGVPQHSGDRGDLLELKGDKWFPNIAGMQNMLDPGKQPLDLRVEVIVRIRNDADFQALASSGVSPPAGSSCGSCARSGSGVGSIASVNFIAPANSPVNNPPLSSVFRKNAHVGG